MKFLSVCSGIEAASVAWKPLGWEAVAYSEIDAFPCSLLHHHYGSGRPLFMPDPDAEGLSTRERRERLLAVAATRRLPAWAGPASNTPPNLGDMSRFEEWPDVPDFDVLCGGTPCQSFSVAGLRGGLADARGNLMLTFGRIAAKRRPRWLAWENVPGVLSSGGGSDFASFLGLVTGRVVSPPPGGWSSAGIIPGIDSAYGVAWRVFDAQYFGVAQRRRRVFVVGYLGDWRRAAAVLFERASLRGDPAPRRETRAHAAPDAAGGVGAGGAGMAHDGGGGGRGAGRAAGGAGGVARTLTSSTGGASAKEQQYTFVRADGVPLNALNGEACQLPGLSPGGSFWDGGQVTSCLDASVGAKRQTMPDKDRFMAALVPAVPVFTGDGKTADPLTANEASTYTHEGSRNFRMHNVVGHAVDLRNSSVGPVAQTLQAGGMGDERGLCPNAIPHVIAFSAKDHGQDATENLSPTLRSGVHGASHANGGVMPAVAFKASHFTRGKDGAPAEVHPPLTADADKGDQDPLVLAPAEPFAFQSRVARNGRGAPSDVVPALTAEAGETGKGDSAPLVASTVMLVRRLMPGECELLQGFDWGYTDVPYRGKPAADGPRYKALGNSWCVFNARWLGRRMQEVDALFGL